MGIGAEPLDDNAKQLVGWDATNHRPAVPQISSTSVDASGVVYGVLNVSGSITASNPSVGTDGSAIPLSSTLLGASDGTNLQQLLVESSSNRNLRVGIYNGANEVAVDASGRLTLIPNSGVNVAQINGVTPLMGNGVTGTGSLRVTVASDNTAFSVNAAQSGTWNITNISGTVSLPTGAATSAKQPALGTAGTASSDVLSVQGIASMTALKVDGSGVTQPVSGTFWQATQPVSGTVSITANSSVNVAQVAGTTTDTNSGNKSAGTQRVVIATDQPQLTNALKVDGSGVTQPVSGTITANAGTNLNTSSLALDTSVNGILLSQGSTTSGQKGPLVLGAITTNAPSYTTAQSSPLSLDTSGLLRASLKDTPSNTNNLNVNLAASAATVTVSGTVTANQGGSNWSTNMVQVGGTNVVTGGASGLLAVGGPVASGATNADNPVKHGGAFNTTQPTVTNGQIVDAQYTARGAAIVATGVDAFAVNASQSGTWTVQPGNTANTTAWKVDGSAVTQPVSGTVTANAGTNLNTSALALDTSVNGVLLSQGSTTSGQKGPVVQGAVTTSAPSYTTAQTSPLSLTTAGALRTDASATTQPISGTITANQGGTWTVQPGNTANTTAWKVDGSAVTQPVSGTVTANAGTNLNTSALALDTSVNGVIVAQGSTTSGEKGPMVQGAVTTSAPSYTTAQTSPLSLTTAGALRTDASATTQPVSGTITSNQGGTWTVQPGNTANTTAWKVDGSAVTQPVSGTVTANQGGSNWSTNVAQIGGTNIVTGGASGLIAVGGPVASGGTNADNPVKHGGVFNTTQPTVTNGQVVDAQYSARGAAIVATGTDTFNVTVNAALPAGGNTIGAVTQASGPWTSNLTQVNGTTVAVGSNAVPILTSAATGYVSAYGSNAAALTATTDYAFKWGGAGTTVVNHIMLQNNSGANVQFDLDVAANAGSPILATGQTIFFDVQTTALHLYAAGTPNVNGSSASNIVVRGWL